MAETTPRKSQSETEEEEKHGKHHNFIEKAKEKIEKVIHSPRRHRHDKETHGTSNDIDETTSVDEVKGPNVFQRAKEEIEALVETIHPKKEKEKKHHYHDKETHGTSKDIDETTSVDEVRGPNVFQRTKEEIEALVETMHHKKEKEKKEKEKEHHHHHHDKETHGTSDDIDETTSINEVKGPNVFQRAKEEIEALVETMHHKKDEDNKSSQHQN